MALTKIGKEGITGISNASDATAITITSGENVGIGETASANLLHVKASDTGIAPHASAQIVLEREGTNYLQFLTAENGTSGCLFGDGSDVDVGKIVYDHNVPAMQFQVETAEAMRITTAGNVGIGTTNPGTSKLYLEDNHTTDVTNAATMIANTVLTINGNASEGSDVLRVGPVSSAGKYFMEVSNSAGNAAYNLCLNPINGGALLVGMLNNNPIDDGTSGVEIGAGYVNLNKASGTSHYIGRSGSDGAAVLFYKNTSNVGSISLSSSATAYNTSSDYRLKENVDYTWDATTRLKQLKPARFNFIADDTNTLIDGFIAHEVSSVVPEAISGAKDAMTAEVLYAEGDELPDGKSVGDVKKPSVIDPQGIDQSKLVPLLVKTIQELEARITALEA